MDASLMGPVVVVAMLVIRTALLEIRRPGSARWQWGFLHHRRPMTAGVTVAMLLSVGGWRAGGMAPVAWALLAGALVAHIVNLSSRPQTDRAECRRGGRH